jgi:hypothetical protein
MPRIVMQGRWNEGNVGNLNFGDWKDMCGIWGRPHRTITSWRPLQPGQPTRTGTTVEVPPSSVVIYVLPVHEDSVTVSIENSSGTVAIVEVIVSKPEDERSRYDRYSRRVCRCGCSCCCRW